MWLSGQGRSAVTASTRVQTRLKGTFFFNTLFYRFFTVLLITFDGVTLFYYILY